MHPLLRAWHRNGAWDRDPFRRFYRRYGYPPFGAPQDLADPRLRQHVRIRRMYPAVTGDLPAGGKYPVRSRTGISLYACAGQNASHGRDTDRNQGYQRKIR